MKFSFNKLPKSLKKVLTKTGNTQGIKVKDYFKKVERDGQIVIQIDYKFEHNYHMYQSFFEEELKNIVNKKTFEFPKLMHRVGTFLFGDNVENFYNIHENDNGEGNWEIIIENPSIKDWLSVDVYLIPKKFQIE